MGRQGSTGRGKVKGTHGRGTQETRLCGGLCYWGGWAGLEQGLGVKGRASVSCHTQVWNSRRQWSLTEGGPAADHPGSAQRLEECVPPLRLGGPHSKAGPREQGCSLGPSA